MKRKKNIVVLVSGGGSNLQSIIDACNTGKVNGEVVAVISNISSAFALKRAEKANIKGVCLDHTLYSSREEFDHALAAEIHSHSPDIIVLAGFMRILSEFFVGQFNDRLLNIHPSLLPKYKGLHTHKRALENKDEYHGCSVHFVNAELDGGPVVIQSRVKVEDNDSPDSLARKIAKKEWLIYPLVLEWVCQERLILQKDHVLLDNKKIQKQGLLYEDLLKQEVSQK